MKFTKRQIFYLVIVTLIALFLSVYKLPYYIQKPGGADELNPIVEVVDGYESEGDMHLVTVRGGQATPIQYLFANILPHQDIMPLHHVRPEGISEEEYIQAQLQMMDSSQEKAIVVAYQAANEEIIIEDNGVYVVSVLEGVPADDILQIGDLITVIDNIEMQSAEDLMAYVENKKAGETITIGFIRGDEELEESITLAKLKELDNNVGIGISLVTDRRIQVNPEVKFSSGRIGGPSAGLMFSLEIYDQLTEEDLTKGFEIAGTGEVDYEGNVLRIGGIDKKVIAADREGCDIFFAPNENGASNSNYELANETAKQIGTDMEIVPIDTFQDALTYLQQLEKK